MTEKEMTKFVNELGMGIEMFNTWFRTKVKNELVGCERSFSYILPFVMFDSDGNKMSVYSLMPNDEDIEIWYVYGNPKPIENVDDSEFIHESIFDFSNDFIFNLLKKVNERMK